MIFALLFFASFIIGLFTYVMSERWWLGGVLCTLALMFLALTSLNAAALQGVAIYFGVPIVFLGSLFGAYIVQLRRGPDIEDMDNDSDLLEKSEDEVDDLSDTTK